MKRTKTKQRTDRASGEEGMAIVAVVAIKGHCYMAVNGHYYRLEGLESDVARHILRPIRRLNAIQAARCVGRAVGKATK